MTTRDELHALLTDPALSHPERMRHVRALTDVEDRITEGLSNALATRDWATFETYLWAAFHHPATSMTPILCKALSLRS